MIWEELDTPCARLGASPYCTHCQQTVDDGKPRRCYRAGRAVRRIVRLREAVASIPSRERTVWDRIRAERRMPSLEPFAINDILKRHYGPKYEGRYDLLSVASGLSTYEYRRYYAGLGPKPRSYWQIHEKIRDKSRMQTGRDQIWLGEDPVKKLLYTDNPFFALLPKTG